MANICYNEFCITIEGDCKQDIFESLKIRLENSFSAEIYDSSYGDDYSYIEGSFDSRWCFPHNLFKGFFESFNDDTIYFRCLSIEYGCNALNIYEDSNWKEEQTFNF